MEPGRRGRGAAGRGAGPWSRAVEVEAQLEVDWGSLFMSPNSNFKKYDELSHNNDQSLGKPFKTEIHAVPPHGQN